MEDILILMFAIFAIFVLPIGGGLLMAYTKMKQKHEERMALNRSAEGHEAEIEGLSRIADILDQRVQVLERILDDEVPDWRSTHMGRDTYTETSRVR